ncbi:hypothetical protein ACFE04_028152 [Oxalis oulophora]
MYKLSHAWSPSRLFLNGKLTSHFHNYLKDVSSITNTLFHPHLHVPTNFRWTSPKSNSRPTYQSGRWPVRQAETKVVQNILHMNVGDGEHSYAKNSLLQEIVISKTKPILEDAIKEMFGVTNLTMPTFTVAELGCSSGPNTLLTISYIIDAVCRIFQEKNITKAPDFQVFLNDLPGNDFNKIFESLPDFLQKLKKEKERLMSSCFISGHPSSFYEMLFPSNTLHFVHSSYSIHWLSQVPNGLVNKGNIYMAKNSPPHVFQAYLKQYQKDFFLLLSLRAKEMVSDGRMVLTFIGRAMINPSESRDCCYHWEALTKSLFGLVDEGLIEEADIDSFNVPIYTPHEEEVREIVKMEGSFTIEKLEMFQINNDPRDDVNNTSFVFNETEVGNNAAKYVRAALEPILARHFGAFVMDNLFAKYAKLLGENWCFEKAKNTIMVISLKKRNLKVCQA